jgi:hypothetical protein
MDDSDLPPLSSYDYEELEKQLREKDSTFRNALREMQVPLLPDPAPQQLTENLRMYLSRYAEQLFYVESRTYPSDSQLKTRLVNLPERIRERVMKTVAALESEGLKRTPPHSLAYHGLSEHEMRQAIDNSLQFVLQEYLQKLEQPPKPVPIVPSNFYEQIGKLFSGSRSPKLPAVSDRQTPKELYRSYVALFPDEKIKIRDICWAASQYYREWTRWMGGQLKDGFTADRAFRRVLTSGKRPSEIRKQARPKNWK